MDSRLLYAAFILMLAACCSGTNVQIRLPGGTSKEKQSQPVKILSIPKPAQAKTTIPSKSSTTPVQIKYVKPVVKAQASVVKTSTPVKTAAPVNPKPFIPTYNSAYVQPYVKPFYGPCNQGSHGFWGQRWNHKEHHDRGKHHHYGFLLYHFLRFHLNDNYSKAKIIEIVKSFETEDSTEALTNLMTAITSKDAKPALNFFALKGLKVEDAKKVLNQLKSGDPAQIQQAKNTIHNVAKSIDFKSFCPFSWYYLRHLAAVYYDYMQRVKAKEVVSTDPLEKLIAGLVALAAVEDRHKIKGINFQSLVTRLETQGEVARPSVVLELSAWIDKTDIHTLQIVGFIYQQATAHIVITTTVPTTTVEMTTPTTTVATTTPSTTTTTTTTTTSTTVPVTGLP